MMGRHFLEAVVTGLDQHGVSLRVKSVCPAGPGVMCPLWSESALEDGSHEECFVDYVLRDNGPECLVGSSDGPGPWPIRVDVWDVEGGGQDVTLVLLSVLTDEEVDMAADGTTDEPVIRMVSPNEVPPIGDRRFAVPIPSAPDPELRPTGEGARDV